MLLPVVDKGHHVGFLSAAEFRPPQRPPDHLGQQDAAGGLPGQKDRLGARYVGALGQHADVDQHVELATFELGQHRLVLICRAGVTGLCRAGVGVAVGKNRVGAHTPLAQQLDQRRALVPAVSEDDGLPVALAVLSVGIGNPGVADAVTSKVGDDFFGNVAVTALPLTVVLLAELRADMRGGFLHDRPGENACQHQVLRADLIEDALGKELFEQALAALVGIGGRGGQPQQVQLGNRTSQTVDQPTKGGRGRVVALVEHDGQPGLASIVQKTLQASVNPGVQSPRQSLQRDDEHVVGALDFRDLAVAEGARHGPQGEPLLLAAHMPDFVAPRRVRPKAPERLIEQVVGVGQPDDLVAPGQRPLGEKAGGRECFASAGRQDQNAAAHLPLSTRPPPQRLQGVFLMRGGHLV